MAMAHVPGVRNLPPLSEVPAEVVGGVVDGVRASAQGVFALLSGIGWVISHPVTAVTTVGEGITVAGRGVAIFCAAPIDTTMRAVAATAGAVGNVVRRVVNEFDERPIRSTVSLATQMACNYAMARGASYAYNKVVNGPRSAAVAAAELEASEEAAMYAEFSLEAKGEQLALKELDGLLTSDLSRTEGDLYRKLRDWLNENPRVLYYTERNKLQDAVATLESLVGRRTGHVICNGCSVRRATIRSLNSALADLHSEVQFGIGFNNRYIQNIKHLTFTSAAVVVTKTPSSAVRDVAIALGATGANALVRESARALSGDRPERQIPNYKGSEDPPPQEAAIVQVPAQQSVLVQAPPTPPLPPQEFPLAPPPSPEEALVVQAPPPPQELPRERQERELVAKVEKSEAEVTRLAAQISGNRGGGRRRARSQNAHTMHNLAVTRLQDRRAQLAAFLNQ